MTTKLETPDYLSEINSHPRDKFITFDEGPHIYTVHGKQGYTSVTTWNHEHFEKFDEDKIIENILSSSRKNDPKYKYYGMTKEDIKKSWDKNREQASSLGTKMHYDIECYYNNIDNQNKSLEFDYFKKFVKDYPELKAYRTEWTIYHEEIKISGSIDMVFKNEKTDTYEIYDWKRCKQIEYENMSKKTAITPCISHLPDANFWHYSLQLNTYRKILQEKYDLKISGMYLICIHPDNAYKTYDRIEIPFLEKEMDELFEYRKSQIINQNLI